MPRPPSAHPSGACGSAFPHGGDDDTAGEHVHTDADFGGWVQPSRGVPAAPLVRGLVEFTRGGRRAVRASDYAAPVPREPRAAEHRARLDEYADLLATAMRGAPRFRLDAGDLLVLDNYRFLHGRDGYSGNRTLHVLTVRTTDAF